MLPTSNASGAWFSDEGTAAMTITVGTFEIPNATTHPARVHRHGRFAQVIVGTSGDDHLVAGNGGALVFGLGGDDTLDGGNGKDCLVGGEGDDILVGGNGKDVLLGGEGDDTLHGGGDNDVIEGGNGKDLLDGGAGNDACYGTAKDQLRELRATVPQGRLEGPRRDAGHNARSDAGAGPGAELGDGSRHGHAPSVARGDADARPCF